MRVSPHIAVGVLALALMAAAGDASAQNTRPPALNAQYHRAETAWRSGTSVLEAKTRVDRVLREMPDDEEARKLRAQILLSMRRPQEALADARRAVALKPRDGEAHLILCEAARQCGQEALALRALDDAAAHLMDNAALHVRLSWNAVALRQIDKAEAFARTALALDGRSAAAYYQLARVFMLQDRRDAAAETLARGLRASLLDPSYIARDPELRPLSDHPLLREYLPR